MVPPTAFPAFGIDFTVDHIRVTDNNSQLQKGLQNRQNCLQNGMSEEVHNTAGGYEEAVMGSASSPRNLDGRFSLGRSITGLTIHTTDATEIEDGEFETEIQPSISVSVVLAGSFSAAFDDQEFSQSAHCGPSGLLWLLPKPTKLRRKMRANMRIRKALVTAPLNGFSELVEDIHDLSLNEMMLVRWQPSAAAISRAEQLIRSAHEIRPLTKLQRERDSFALLEEAIGSTVRSPGSFENTGVRRSDRLKAVRMMEFIRTNEGRNYGFAEVANAVALSERAANRLFRSVYGQSPMSFARDLRLEKGRLALAEGASVKQAAYVANYRSSGNFSTAFRKRFGYCPSSYSAADKS